MFTYLSLLVPLFIKHKVLPYHKIIYSNYYNCTLAWIDLALLAIFEIEHIAVFSIEVYFQKFNSIKAAKLTAHAAKF